MVSKMSVGEEILADAITIVLVRTSHPGNVGAVARAMKNMGLARLVLVNPELAYERNSEGDDVYLSPLVAHDAVRRASGAEDILRNAKICSSLNDALADIHVVIGASARSRKMTWPLMNPRDCADLVIAKAFEGQGREVSKSSGNRVALMFGNEASGLSNDELHRCHYHVNIPAVESFSSLNLAMAVQLVAYELRMALLLKDSSAITSEGTGSGVNEQLGASLSAQDEGWDEALASVDEVENFFAHLEKTLIATGFHDPEKPRQLMVRLRRLYQRAHLDKMEVNILRGILTSTLKYGKK
jgi:tRNA (cytidine32/uridine32-2'-O)-methyltransferase